MMIYKREVLAISRKLDIPPSTIEKDYVLGWILLGIANHQVLSRFWIFKGGTCIKKCYIPDYRFSEDLDFTVKSTHFIAIDFLRSAFLEAMNWVMEHSEIFLDIDSLKLEKHREIGNYSSVQGSFSYRGPLMMKQKALPKIKLDLTSDEIITTSPTSRKIYHEYSDRDCFLQGEVLCYSFEELFSEKLRALVQRLRPRDLFDVVKLFDLKDSFNMHSFRETLNKKFNHKNIAFPTFSSFMRTPMKRDLSSTWKHMLGHQVPNLGSETPFWRQLEGILNWVNERVLQ